MNKKKFILPIAVAALGFTACNKGLNVDVAAERAVDSLIATCKKLDTFGVNLNVGISKGDLKIRHDGVPTKEYENWGLTLKDATIDAEVNVNNLKYYNSELMVNPNLQVAAKVDNLDGQVGITYEAKELGASKADAATLEINDISDDLGKLDVRAYLNKSYEVVEEKENDTEPEYYAYGCFFDWGNTFRLIDNVIKKTKMTNNPEYIERVLEALTGYKNFISPSYGQKLKTNMANIKVIPTLAIDVLFGMAAYKIEEIGNLNDNKAEKAEYVTKVTEFLTEANSDKDIGQIISMSTSGDSTTFTMNLPYQKINTMIKKSSNDDNDVFTGGNVKVTLSSDDNKCISNFTIEANDLKANEFPLSFGSKNTDEETKYLTINDLSAKVELNINYDIDAHEAFKEVPDYVTAEQYTDIKELLPKSEEVSLNGVSVALAE